MAQKEIAPLLIGLLDEFDSANIKKGIKGFDCGDSFLNRTAKQLIKKGPGTNLKSYLAVQNGSVAAYCTLRVGQLDGNGLDKHIPEPSKIVPVIVLEQIAVDTRFQGQGIGSRLLVEVVFETALMIYKRIGLMGVALWAVPNAISFYSKLGFINTTVVKPLEGMNLTLMFIPIQTLQEAYSSA